MSLNKLGNSLQPSVSVEVSVDSLSCDKSLALSLVR